MVVELWEVGKYGSSGIAHIIKQNNQLLSNPIKGDVNAVLNSDNMLGISIYFPEANSQQYVLNNAPVSSFVTLCNLFSSGNIAPKFIAIVRLNERVVNFTGRFASLTKESIILQGHINGHK